MKHLLKLAVAVLTLTAFVGVVQVSPAQSGEQANHSITYEKLVVGDADPATVFEIAISCTETGDDTLEFVAGEQETEFYDFDETCTITEPDTQGAVVSFTCAATGDATCESDNVVVFGVEGDADVTITIVNDFSGEPVTTTTAPASTSTSAAAAAAAVAAPTFTG